MKKYFVLITVLALSIAVLAEGSKGNREEREVRSIKNLSTKEMSEYMDKVSLWANAEMGIFLPIPADQQRR